MKAKLIGIVGYDGVNALDIAGPAEAFASAVIGKSDGNAIPHYGYKIVIIAATAKPFTSESGVVLKPHTTLHRFTTQGLPATGKNSGFFPFYAESVEPFVLQCKMGGVYGDGTTESSLSSAAGTAGTARRHGQFAIPSGGTGEPGQDYFTECFRQDEPADCAPDGTYQRDGGQVAAAILGAGCVRVA